MPDFGPAETASMQLSNDGSAGPLVVAGDTGARAGAFCEVWVFMAPQGINGRWQAILLIDQPNKPSPSEESDAVMRNDPAV